MGNKIPSDQKVLEAYNDWQNEIMDQASVNAFCEFTDAAEMTPIELLVFFRLKTYESLEKWDFRCQESIGKYRVDFYIKNVSALGPDII